MYINYREVESNVANQARILNQYTLKILKKKEQSILNIMKGKS